MKKDYVRDTWAREIMKFILEHNLCTFIEIVEHWRSLNLLYHGIFRGIISVKYGQEYQLYQILHPGLIVADVLYKCKESLADKVVNKYTQIVDEL